MDSIAAILGDIQRKGVRLWAGNGRLHYQAPAGALTREELEGLRVYRPQIVALLEPALEPGALEPLIEPGSRRRDRAPLSYSQLAHWQLFNLGERRSVRHVAIACRIRGHLNVELLRHSIAEVVRRHDALRTRIVVLDGIPTQVVDESSDCELPVDNLTGLPQTEREREVERRVVAHPLEAIDVSVDSLFDARLLKIGDDDHVLLVAMEHMISDGRSRSIFLREVFTAYAQLARGSSISLPSVPLQFTDYAVWQRHSQIPRLEKRIAYWQAHVASCPTPRLPVDGKHRADGRQGLGIVGFHIDEHLRAKLRAWCRQQRTTLVMSACTAYFALLFRWCQISDTVIRFQTDGRFATRTADVFGYMSFPLYMRVQCQRGDRLADLLSRVTEEHGRALEHADFSYLEAQVPRPEFTRSTRFNWFSQSAGSTNSIRDGSQDAIACSRIYPVAREIENFPANDDPSIVFSESDAEIRGSVTFPLQRFSFATMERFASNYLLVLRTLLGESDARVNDITLA
jgi:hypothetical protein